MPPTHSTFSLPYRLAQRELRGGIRDFRIFLACLILSIAVMVLVGMVTEAIHRGIHAEARNLLGGDVEITLTGHPPLPEQQQFFERYGTTSTVSETNAMLQGEQPVLVELKAVDHHYPLTSALTLEPPMPLSAALQNHGAAVEEILLRRTGLKLGDTITLGSASFTIRAIIRKEPDRALRMFSLGPRVLIGSEYLQQTGLVMPGSLLHYSTRILLMPPATAASFTQALSTAFPQQPWRIKTTSNANPSLEEFIDQLNLFLMLGGLATLLIGGIGIAQSVDGFLNRKTMNIASLKTLGASSQLIFTSYALVIAIITAIGTIIGSALGIGITFLILPYVARYFPVSTTVFFCSPLLVATWFGLLTVASFSYASLSRHVATAPAVLFRGTITSTSRMPHTQRMINIALAFMLVISLVMFSADSTVSLGFIAATLLCFGIFSLFSRVMQSAARRIHCKRPWLRLALANVSRPGSSTTSIILATGIGLTILIALMLVEANFQKRINETIPTQSPSLFMLDIQPTQKETLVSMLNRPSLSHLTVQPMIRGRIVKVNGAAVTAENVSSSARWAVRSERGFTYNATPPENAHIVQGSWWPADYRGAALVSMDRNVAKGMGITPGDKITVNIIGEELEATVTNLRNIDYSTFQINFALIFSPGAIEAFPSTLIATIHSSDAPSEAAIIQQMARQFPNISIIRIADSIAQIKEIIRNISRALTLIVLLTMTTGILVLSGALSSSVQARMYDTVILKVLGAERIDIIKSFLAEWLLLGCCTALISTVLGTGAAWLILQRLNTPQFYIVPAPVLLTVALCLGGFTLLGLMGHLSVFYTRAAAYLRNE
jgi:putative ABC transport system permease protein